MHIANKGETSRIERIPRCGCGDLGSNPSRHNYVSYKASGRLEYDIWSSVRAQTNLKNRSVMW